MRNFVLSLVVVAGLASSFAWESAADEKKMKIYLLIGQSNMAGRAPFTSEQAEEIPNAYLLNGDDQWEPAKNPLNRYSTIRKSLNMQKMNPGYAFSQALVKEDPTTSIGLVVNAKGGSSIKEWEKGTRFYSEAIRRTRIAQKSGKLSGILWHQGESDAGDEAYLEKLKKLIADLRSDLDAPKLPFVAGQVQNVKIINDQVAQLPDVVSHTAFASSNELTTFDRWHFDSRSMIVLGRRYAEAMKLLEASASEQE